MQGQEGIQKYAAAHQSGQDRNQWRYKVKHQNRGENKVLMEGLEDFCTVQF